MSLKHIESLLSIFSIPLEEEWEEFGNKDCYTIYQYWKDLGLLDETQYDKAFTTKKLEGNPILLNYFKMLNYHFKPSYYFDQKVADVGSGYGFITIWLILNGARVVYSIGDSKRIEFIDRLYKTAVARNLIEDGKLFLKPSFLKVGDLILAETIEPDSLSMVLLNDTLEHINPRVFPFLVKSCFNNLKSGGVFVSRQQNTDSPKMLDKLRIVWEKGETETYLAQRFELIIKKIQPINKEEANILAIKTRGLDSIDFNNALAEFEENKKYPEHDLEIPPFDLDVDVPHEGYTSINKIFSEFQANGFKKMEVYPDLLASKRSKFFQPLARKIPNFFLTNKIFDQTTVFVITK